MYESEDLAIRIKQLAQQKNIVIKNMLNELGLGINTMSSLYHGKMMSSESLARIADYLGCSVDYLLGRSDNPDKADVTTDDVKVALFGGDKEVTDEMWTEVKNFVDYVKQKNADKK